MTNNELINRLQHKDQSAYVELISAFQDHVVNTCYGFVQSEEDARDVAQEVFVEVFLSIRHFRADASLGTWIYRIAINKSLDFIRKKNRKKRMAILLGFAGMNPQDQKRLATNVETPSALLEQKERRDLLNTAIKKLPENQRVAWTLHKIEQISYSEIANIMGTSVPAVESLIHRAKKKLYTVLERIME
ncbi:MAG: RNA polymerase sigma factor [bacterium]